MRENIRNTLLIQIRKDPEIAEEEYASFLKFGQLSPRQMSRVDVFRNPSLEGITPSGYQAVFIGGASDASVLAPETYPFVVPAREFLRDCLDAEVPVFASCFGFQLAVQALGGEIIHQAEGFEMGTLPISLTPAAADDPLFRNTPDGFFAVSVHRELAVQLPDSCLLLASTSACCHAFRVTGKPFWAFQFHPEVDRATLVSRLTHYKTHYTGNDTHLQEVLDHSVETPDSNALVGRFVDWLEHSCP